MERTPRRSTRLQHQLTLASALPLLLFGILTALVCWYAFREISLRLIRQRNTVLAQTAAAGVVEDLSGYLRPLQATADALGERADSGGLPSQTQLLHDWAPLLRGFEGGVTLLDGRGIGIAATPGHEERVGLDYAFRDYFRSAQATGQATFSAVLHEQPSGQNAVVVATPIEAGGQPPSVLIGVLFIGQHPWARDLEPLRTQIGGQVYLVDAGGNVIYHPDAAQLGTSVLDDPDLGRLVAAGRADSLLRTTGGFRQPVVTSFAPLSSVGWGLFMEEPWQAILAPAVPYAWAVVGLILLGSLLSLALMLVGLRRGLRPLKTLVAKASQVSAGAPFRPIQQSGPAELQALIGVFNRMVSYLEEQQAAARRFAGQVLQSQEDERKRLSRELHDETVQDLVGLVQRLELCRNELIRDPGEAKRRLDELQMLAKVAVDDVRRMSNDLRPLILEDLGLPVALQALVEELGEDLPAAQVTCRVDEPGYQLSSMDELIVFRIAQEALNNIRKHARTATKVDLTLARSEDELTLTVSDNGPGFQARDAGVWLQEGHLGLAGMVERAKLAGGRLTIDSAPGRGAVVALQLPILQGGESDAPAAWPSIA